ncbi:FAD-dependent monooxygenase [Mycobacterium sp. 1423905.2]|uniref:FAD-dependent monooxygenase n=1 Tax=Mycobacterium sp. 1423905.2 TaxID=1856859 RepID=UPI000801D54F|nr:FAD-dependent monooxygenase [Mycobacterium sp. 1423905.2]OBJ57420.1 FAD-dependent oxidoreductase [Mycobacterium sp. 1423905.2]
MKVVICGAGIAGLALAERLATHGADVVVLERAPGPRRHGQLIDFHGAGYDAAEEVGVLPAIEDAAYRIDEASLMDADGRRRAGLPYRQIAAALDGRLCRIMRADLETALRNNLPDAVELRFGASVSAVGNRDDGVSVTLDDGEHLEADLLVGADGLHSTVRALVFGDESQYLRYLGFHTAAFICDAPEIRAAAADRVLLTDTVDRQLGCYVLRDGRVATFGVHRSADPRLPDDARAAIQDSYADMGRLVPEVLHRCPPATEIYYDQVAEIHLPSWRKNRVVLIGDACAAVSWFAGQSASLAVGAAYVLAEQLRLTSSLDRALDFYERLWRPVIDEKQRAGRDAAGRIVPATPAQLRRRRTGLRLSWFPPVNRRIVAASVGEPTAVIPMLRRGSEET